MPFPRLHHGIIPFAQVFRAAAGEPRLAPVEPHLTASSEECRCFPVSLACWFSKIPPQLWQGTRKVVLWNRDGKVLRKLRPRAQCNTHPTEPKLTLLFGFPCLENGSHCEIKLCGNLEKGKKKPTQNTQNPATQTQA